MTLSHKSALERSFVTRWRQLSSGRHPSPQHGLRPHPTRRWELDFAWPDYRVAVELDGFGRGRRKGGHQTISGMNRDREKDNTLLVDCDWLTLRYTSAQLSDDPMRVVEQIEALLDKRKDVS